MADLATLEPLLARYAKISAERPFDPFADIDWDELACSAPDDERWLLPGSSPYARSAWWAGAAPADRHRLALTLAAHTMAMAIGFERVLQSALLTYATSLPVTGVEFRYVHHEIIEESRHSQMFAAFLGHVGHDRSSEADLVAWERSIDLERLAVTAPEVVFTAALAGEEPIDRLQRALVRTGGHPTLQAVCRRHIAEESRHIGYARELLRAVVPTFDRKRRRRLSLLAPPLAHRAAWLMAVPAPAVLAGFGLGDPADPGDPLHDDLVAHAQDLASGLESLFVELGLAAPDDERWRRWRPVAPTGPEVEV